MQNQTDHSGEELLVQIPAAQLGGLLRLCLSELNRIQNEDQEIEVLTRQTTAEMERLKPAFLDAADNKRAVSGRLEQYTREELIDIWSGFGQAELKSNVLQAQSEQLAYKKYSLQKELALARAVIGVLQPHVSGVALEGLGAENVVATSEAGLARQIVSFKIADMVMAREAAGLEVARDLSDVSAQTIANLVLRTEIVQRLLDAGDGRAKSELSEMKEALASSLDRVRRLSSRFRASMVSELGLSAAIQRYLKEMSDRTNLDISLDADGLDERRSVEAQVFLFRVLQGGVELALVSPDSKSLHIDVRVAEWMLDVEIIDDGLDGAGAPRATQDRMRAEKKASLQSLLNMVGGQCSLEALPDGGHRVTVQASLESFV